MEPWAASRETSPCFAQGAAGVAATVLSVADWDGRPSVAAVRVLGHRWPPSRDAVALLDPPAGFGPSSRGRPLCTSSQAGTRPRFLSSPTDGCSERPTELPSYSSGMSWNIIQGFPAPPVDLLAMVVYDPSPSRIRPLPYTTPPVYDPSRIRPLPYTTAPDNEGPRSCRISRWFDIDGGSIYRATRNASSLTCQNSGSVPAGFTQHARQGRLRQPVGIGHRRVHNRVRAPR